MTFPPAGPHLTSNAALKDLLLGAGLRPTTQRLILARLLFEGDHRHVTASELHDEAQQRDQPVSMATVYNTLGQLVSAGLLGEVSLDNECIYFDTHTQPHCHIVDVDTGELMDAPLPRVDLPEGVDPSRVASVDLLFRVRSR